MGFKKSKQCRAGVESRQEGAGRSTAVGNKNTQGKVVQGGEEIIVMW